MHRSKKQELPLFSEWFFGGGPNTGGKFPKLRTHATHKTKSHGLLLLYRCLQRYRCCFHLKLNFCRWEQQTMFFEVLLPCLALSAPKMVRSSPNRAKYLVFLVEKDYVFNRSQDLDEVGSTRDFDPLPQDPAAFWNTDSLILAGHRGHHIKRPNRALGDPSCLPERKSSDHNSLIDWLRCFFQGQKPMFYPCLTWFC